MEWKQIAETALAIITALGGISAVSLAIVKWGSDIIADRLSKKYQFKLDKEIEIVRAEISRKQHVSVTFFDAEFSLYRDLCKTFSDLLQDIFTIIPVNQKDLPSNQFLMATDDINTCTKELFNHALHASTTAKDIFTANRPFLTKEIMEAFDGILNLTDQQLMRISERYNELLPGEFDKKASITDSDIETSKEIAKRWFAVCDSIRDYLKSLEIV